MKLAVSIVVAVVMPFGIFVLVGVILSRILTKRGQEHWSTRLTIVRGCSFAPSPEPTSPSTL